MFYIIKSDNTSNNIINLKKTLKGEFFLRSFNFLNEIHNVRSNNNILPYKEPAGSLQLIELTTQFVSGNDLASDIQTKIDAVSAGSPVVSYSSATGKFTITNTTAFSLKFGDNTSNTCHELIGFNATNTSDATSHIADNVANLTPYQHILINIKEDVVTAVEDQEYGDNSFIITSQSNFCDMAEYTPKTTDIGQQWIRFNGTKRITIRFYDDNNNELNLNHWSLVLFQ